MKIFKPSLIILAPLLILLFVGGKASSLPACERQLDQERIRHYDCLESDACLAASVGSVHTSLSESIPTVWRSLIAQAGNKYPDSDARLVAALLWAENRGWPEYKQNDTTQNATSLARGPWQFIPATWYGWGSGITNWDGGVDDETLYIDAGLGTDGDGDGIRDPSNPKDAVEAAFKHIPGSSGQLLLPGYDGQVDEAFSSLPFSRDGNTLLAHASRYNSAERNSAPSGQTLESFPRDENSDYVKMVFWLIATDFEQGWLPEQGDFVNAQSGTLFGDSDGGSDVVIRDGNAICGANLANVSSDGYAFPVDMLKSELHPDSSSMPCRSSSCHHDGSPAFDFIVNGTDGIGRSVFAISDGSIYTLKDGYRGESGCYSIQFESDDGYKYWYGHIQNPTVTAGQTNITAGQKIAEIGETRCTGNGSLPHLHIDRGAPKGRTGGNENFRDAGLIPLINKLWEALPE